MNDKEIPYGMKCKCEHYHWTIYQDEEERGTYRKQIRECPQCNCENFEVKG